jgi:hypothetical protein
MYRHSHRPSRTFAQHLMRNIFIGLVSVGIALMIGMVGYHQFEKMDWIDAFVNAAMILSGMGPLGPLQTDAGKIFAGCYALFSGLMFILILGVIFAPIVHRFFLRIHLESKN